VAEAPRANAPVANSGVTRTLIAISFFMLLSWVWKHIVAARRLLKRVAAGGTGLGSMPIEAQNGVQPKRVDQA